MKKVDLTGHRYGLLTVIRKAGMSGSQSLWECRCDCGTTSIKRLGNLRSGQTHSCGHLRSEVTGRLKTKHAMYGTPSYKSWSSMRTRCQNENNHKYPSYGGRGIIVCERWNSFELFFEDMGERPKGTTLGRINNDGNYDLNNCEWQSNNCQARNKRNSALFVFNGKSATISEHCEGVGLNYNTVRTRIYSYGWNIERALTSPIYSHFK